MRVAHVTATFPPYRGGTGNVCHAHARELARRGHSVHVFTAATDGAPGYEMADGAHIHRLRSLVQIGNAPLLPGLAPMLRGFDVIHLHYPFIFGAEMVRAASILHRIPMVISFHNDLIGEGMRGPIFSMYQRLSSSITVSGAAQLCAVSIDHYKSTALCRSLASRHEFVSELSNGVDVRYFGPAGPVCDLNAYGVPSGAKALLFVAALDRAHYFKGLGTLLQSFCDLPPDTYLVIVGDGDLRSAYEQQVQELGIGNRAIFAGAVDNEDLPPFYRAAYLTVMPSSPPESFGLVLVESMACGTPVVTCNIPGVRTVVDDGADGLLVEAGNPVALCGAIQQLLNDENLRQAMGRRGRGKVEARYSWERIGSRLEALYQKLLDRSQLRVYTLIHQQL